MPGVEYRKQNINGGQYECVCGQCEGSQAHFYLV